MQKTNFLSGKRIWIAGHNGMVGSALMRRLRSEDCQILTVSRQDLDLRRQSDVEAWLEIHDPDIVIMAAATVGGILANNQRPASFLYDNLVIEANVIHAAHRIEVEKLLFLGSSCIYPKFANQPISEDQLLTGSLEPTNQWYALAKIAGVKLCEAYRRQYGRDFISVMPTNLYGQNDNFDLATSHVLPALLAKIHAAKVNRLSTVEIWGSGVPRREFLHVDDCADGVVFLLQYYSSEDPINIGTGQDLTIAELAQLMAEVIGYTGEFNFNTAKPDGTPRKLLNITRLTSLGWQARIPLREGISRTYKWFLKHAEGAGVSPHEPPVFEVSSL